MLFYYISRRQKLVFTPLIDCYTYNGIHFIKKGGELFVKVIF